MKLENGILTTTMPAGSQFDGQIHSIEWFHNGAWRRIIDTVYPLQDAEILDDTLDCGGFCFTNLLKPYPDEWMTDENGRLILNSKGQKQENPNCIKFLKRLTPIRILWDSDEDYKPVTDDMSATERAKAEEFNKNLERQVRGKIPVNTDHRIWRYRVVDEINIHNEGMMYKFTVKTVEATKLLELVQCDTLTFTRKLGHEVPLGLMSSGLNYPKWTDYSSLFNQGIIKKPEGTATEYARYRCTLETRDSIITPIKVGTSFDVPILKWSCAQVMSPNVFVASIRVVLVNNADYTEEELFEYDWNDAECAKPHPCTRKEAGSYQIRYYHKGWNCYVDVPFSVVEVLEDTAESVPKYMELTMKDVLDRILSAGKTRRLGVDVQKFVLDENTDYSFYNLQAPEFCITRATIWEALKMVAGHVHCIPRLNWDEETSSYRIVSFDKLGEMEEYHIKAMHNNNSIAWDVKESLDSYCGELNTYVDNLVNTKDEAEGSIIEPYAGGWKSARAHDGEIIVEDNTVVFNMSRPNMRVSKLEVKYGGKEADITKFLFEAAEYNALSSFAGTFPSSTSYALKFEQGGKEITELNHTSKSIGAFGDAFNTQAIVNILKKVGIDVFASTFKDIQYRITYSPIVSARIVQMKPYLEDCNGYSRNYNVAGNTIESEYLGEHLKGAIARVGSDIEYRTYMFERCKDIPKPGMILDGKYIMKVTTRMDTVRFIKSTLILASDYNQKHEYLAIDSSIRYFDVSEKQSVERHVNYGDIVVIGDSASKSVGRSMASMDAIKTFAKLFDGWTEDEQVSWAWFKGTSKRYGAYLPKELNAIMLPCLSQAEGNSLVFNFACADNYSAGLGINYPIGLTKAVQTQVQYGNIYGEIENLNIEFGNDKGIHDYEKSYDDLPLWKGEKPVGLFSTGNNPFIIEKDSREHLNVTYQVHCVANRKSIIIGSALCKYNPLVTSRGAFFTACYWVPKLINKFDSHIDVSDGKRVIFNPDTRGTDSGWFTLPSVSNPYGNRTKCALVWVVLDSGNLIEAQKHAKLIIGENYPDGVGGSQSKSITFSFCSNK